MDLWQLTAIPRDRLGAGTRVAVRIGGDAADVARLMAEEMSTAIFENNRQGRATCLIVPVGPVGQYPILARIIAEQQIDCSRVTFINMDEFLGDDGRWIDPAHPFSFRGFMQRSFYDLLPASAGFRAGNQVFPDPGDPPALQRIIDDRGGVDICFGGIGLNGHVAFNEPEDVAIDEFATRPTRCLAVAPVSRAHMAINLSCALGLVPARAITVGMKEILAARRISLYANRPWQCGVVRQALHGPVSASFPVSCIQRHADAALTMADFVADAPEVALR